MSNGMWFVKVAVLGAAVLGASDIFRVTYSEVRQTGAVKR